MTVGLCEDCRLDPELALSDVYARIREAEDRLTVVHSICSSCDATAQAEPSRCDSLACPWFYQRVRAEERAENAMVLQELAYEVEQQADTECEPERETHEVVEVDSDDGLYASLDTEYDDIG